MKNKFKIRNLENEKRRIDKEIARLRNEEDKTIAVLTEERTSVIHAGDKSNTLTQKFTYTFKRKGNAIMCILADGQSFIIGRGIARCCDEDVFDQKIGCTIAERRAVADYYKQIEKAEVRRYK